jgi:lipoate-protein ligase A
MLELLVSPFNDPYLNLAIENQLLESLEKEQEYLFLYVNDPSIVIGRFQNPWLECSPGSRTKTSLVRRQSGGGTVYHDMGNLNFSFIRLNDSYSRRKNLEIICQIMKECRIDLQINERYDLTVNYREKTYKVSGSAFRHKKNRAFHHGTLLISSETERLIESITPEKQKIIIKASGTSSNRSEIINLNTILPGLTMDQVIQAFKNWFDQEKTCRIRNWSELEWSIFSETEEVKKEYQILRSEDWILGKTPAFSQDISRLHSPETMGWQIRINKGIIEKAPQELSFLIGIHYGRTVTEEELKLKIKNTRLFGMTDDELFSGLISLIG